MATSLLRVALGAAACLCACSDNSPSEPRIPDVNLVFTREDGSVAAFAAPVDAWCDSWENDLVPVPAMHVRTGGESGGWSLRVVLADVVIGEPISFPNSFIWDQPAGADLFVYDPPNELSSSEQESSGSIVFHELECSANGGVDFAIDAVLGSEFGDGPPIFVTGTFSSDLTR